MCQHQTSSYQLGGALTQVACDAIHQYICLVTRQLYHVGFTDLHAHRRPNTLKGGNKILGLVAISPGEHDQIVLKVGRGNDPLPTKLLCPVSIVWWIGILGKKVQTYYYVLYVIVINQLLRFVCNIGGQSLMNDCIYSEGLVNNYFLPTVNSASSVKQYVLHVHVLQLSV